MRNVSPKFQATLRGGHTAVVRARICESYQSGTNPTGTEIPVIGGDVTSQASADVRSTLNITTLVKWPTSASDLLAPYGNEIFVERGVSLGNGQREWVGLGYFRIDSPQQEIVPDGPVTISCPDRMQGIIDARFPTPRQFAATLTRRQLVDTLVKEVYPLADVVWDDIALADAAIGRALAVDSDRAGTITDVATTLGKIAYWDYAGVFQIKTPPSITGVPTWTVDAGRNGVMTRISRSITRQGVYNIQTARSESADSSFPVRYTAYDLGPNSPTRADGRFGPVPADPYSSPLLLTTAQCKLAAEGLLTKSLGLPYVVRLGQIVHAGLEPDDVVLVRYPQASRSASLVSEVHVLDTVKIPLVIEEDQVLDTRSQPVVLFGGQS